MVAEGVTDKLKEFYQGIHKDKDWIVRKALLEVIGEVITFWFSYFYEFLFLVIKIRNRILLLIFS